MMPDSLLVMGILGTVIEMMCSMTKRFESHFLKYFVIVP